MKPAFDLNPTDPSAFATLLDLLNRDAFRTFSVRTRIDLQTWQGSGSTLQETTRYLDVHWPVDDGAVLRAVQMHPSFAISRGSQRAWRVRIAVGLKSGSSFDLLGSEYDSRAADLVDGVAFDLVTREERIPTGSGAVIRVRQVGWPAASVAGLSVESHVGYDGGVS